ncbi:MAG: tRNA threonylcarbamoyladenosine dehydratase [Clostridiales bacterium]|nr:tRNA threonylcarbamoyladenosine dehydratase [Clostridiales bacterium]
MANQFSRTQLLFGDEAMRRLAESRVAVFGIGGVGGYTAEALVRSGIGTLDIIDNDTVDITNINRQIFATHKTVGEYKVDCTERRLLEINPNLKINKHKKFFLPENSDEFDFTKYDYIVDAIDTVSGKIALAVNAQEANAPIISSMGASNKLDPTAFEVADIYDTCVCPLAKVMRRELKKHGVKKLKVVYSREEALKPLNDMQVQSEDNCIDSESRNSQYGKKRSIPGSNAFVPPTVGLIIAGEVIKDIALNRL